GPHVGQGVAAVERVAAGMEVEWDELEATLLVLGRRVDVDGHTAHRVHNALETLEIDLKVVMDRDQKVLLERVDHQLWPTTKIVIERRVDLLLPQPRDVDLEVTRERHQKTRLLPGIDVDHHERVGALPGRVRRTAIPLLLLWRQIGKSPAIGPDQQEI